MTSTKTKSKEDNNINVCGKFADINSKVLSVDDSIRTRYSQLNKIIDGATPKLTTSESESSCLPNSDFASNARAAIPSRKSKTEASIISQAALNSFLPLKAIIIAMHPVKRFNKVSALGKIYFAFFIMK